MMFSRLLSTQIIILVTRLTACSTGCKLNEAYEISKVGIGLELIAIVYANFIFK